MNPSDLERKAGLSVSSVRKILLGSSQNPTLDTLTAIANVFNCSIDELVGKRVFTNNRNDEDELIKDLPWNCDLIKKIIINTCDYIEKNELEKNFEEVINFVAKTYSYCLTKKNGAFDKDFHEWYIQQNLT